MGEVNGLSEERTVAAALKAGAAIGALKIANDGKAYAVVPDGYKLETIDREYVKTPRKKVAVALHDAASFIAYVKAFGDASTRIFGDIEKLSFKAVLDYHEAADGAPRHMEHIATFAVRQTPEWKTWTASSGKGMPQVTFAEFIENNLPDISDPAGAIVLEVVRTLEAKKDVKFASSVRLDNGESRFTYEEDIRGSAAKGTLDVPEKFTLGIAPFQGSDAYKLEARLRYRIKEGSLTLWYDLLRPQRIIDDAFLGTVQQIAEDTDRAVLQGSV